jgi:PhoPQ-activated pathogenicity-related protein
VIVDWLNDALIYRPENAEERHSLAVIFQGVANSNRLEETKPSIEQTETIYPSVL